MCCHLPRQLLPLLQPLLPLLLRRGGGGRAHLVPRQQLQPLLPLLLLRWPCGLVLQLAGRFALDVRKELHKPKAALSSGKGGGAGGGGGPKRDEGRVPTGSVGACGLGERGARVDALVPNDSRRRFANRQAGW